MDRTYEVMFIVRPRIDDRDLAATDEEGRCSRESEGPGVVAQDSPDACRDSHRFPRNPGKVPVEFHVVHGRNWQASGAIQAS